MTVTNLEPRVGGKPPAVRDGDEFRRLLRNGWTVPALAKHYRCSEKTIVRTKHRYGLAQPSPLANRRFTDADRARLANMIEDRWPISEIMATTGWDYRTIQRHAGYVGWTLHESGTFARDLRRIRDNAAEPTWMPPHMQGPKLKNPAA